MLGMYRKKKRKTRKRVVASKKATTQETPFHRKGKKSTCQWMGEKIWRVGPGGGNEIVLTSLGKAKTRACSDIKTADSVLEIHWESKQEGKSGPRRNPRPAGKNQHPKKDAGRPTPGSKRKLPAQTKLAVSWKGRGPAENLSTTVVDPSGDDIGHPFFI